MRLLYRIRHKSKRPRYQPPMSHAGLWHDKFCSTWEMGKSLRWNLAEGQVRQWLETIARDRVGEPGLVAEHTARQAALLNSRASSPLMMVTSSRFLPGHGQEHPAGCTLSWHPVLGVPYLPGSSVKGLARAWAHRWQGADQADIERIFGKPGQAGTVIFLDALPLTPVRLEIDVTSNHHSAYYDDGAPPGDWESPQVRSFLAVAAGTAYQFGVMARRHHVQESLDDAKSARLWLVEALEWLGAGARTSTGYGRFEPQLQAASEA